jgi:hypothetical protein
LAFQIKTVKTRVFKPALVIPLLIGWAGVEPQLDAALVHNESAGLVVMEIENTESPLGLWHLKTSLTPYTGKGYLEFTGNNYSLGDPNSPLKFHFRINKAGTYLIDLMKRSQPYQELLAEREEILRHKWCESERAGRYVGSRG